GSVPAQVPGTGGLHANPRPGSARVHIVRPAQRDFFGTIKPGIDSFDALREAVVLIRYFVLPSAESSTAVYVPGPEHRLDCLEAAVPIERRHRIPVLEARVPGVVNLSLG